VNVNCNLATSVQKNTESTFDQLLQNIRIAHLR
jgi:hypothetical protein